MESLGEQLREMGWRQGVIVPASSFFTTLPDGSPVSDEHFLLAVSQSCDLVHPNLAKEPHAVFLLLTAIGKVDPGVAHGRNPRVLHFRNRDTACYEAVAWRQFVVPREKLCDQPLSNPTKLEEPVLRVVTDWLAKRFTRTAFPDDFNEALRAREGKIKETLKKKHHLFLEILLRLDPFDDLGSGDKYELACYLLMPAESYENPKQLCDARAVAATLEADFEKCGIGVQVCAPVSEADLSYAELKELVRWDFDHLTHREEAAS